MLNMDNNIIKQYENTKYFVTKFGQVYRLAENKDTNEIELVECRQVARGNNYRAVKIYDKLKSVHRLILSTFNPTNDPTLECHHIDGDTTNNNLENLAWVTHTENNRMRFNEGVRLSDEDILAINKMRDLGYTLIEIALMYKTSHNNVIRRLNRYKLEQSKFVESLINGNQ